MEFVCDGESRLAILPFVSRVLPFVAFELAEGRMSLRGNLLIGVNRKIVQLRPFFSRVHFATVNVLDDSIARSR